MWKDQNIRKKVDIMLGLTKKIILRLSLLPKHIKSNKYNSTTVL